jgi:uncharacterized protein
MTGVEVLRAADRRAAPWRNGGGVTTEVARGSAAEGPDDFAWRISIAEVGAAGPFSSYAGVERTIVVIEGSAMRLTIDGVVHDLGLYQPLTFDGAATTFCELPAGPTRDLNLMTTVGRAHGTVEVWRLDNLHERGAASVAGGDVLVLVALAGVVVVMAGGAEHATLDPLDPLDAVSWADRRPVQVSGPGVVAVVRIATG